MRAILGIFICLININRKLKKKEKSIILKERTVKEEEGKKKKKGERRTKNIEEVKVRVKGF